MTKKQTMNIATCIINNKLIRFDPPFVFTLDYVGDGDIAATNIDLDIMTMAKSHKELRLNIEDQIGLLWNEYVNCSVTQLTKDAIEFRNKLKSRVKE